MSKKARPEVTQAILDVVENQIRDGDPVETATTVERLQRQGLPRQEAVRLIACVVASEMFQILKFGESFNEQRFIANLNKLPTMPWD